MAPDSFHGHPLRIKNTFLAVEGIPFSDDEEGGEIAAKPMLKAKSLPDLDILGTDGGNEGSLELSLKGLTSPDVPIDCKCSKTGPCGNFDRPKGCQKGDQCDFCHVHPKKTLGPGQRRRAKRGPRAPLKDGR